MQNSPDCQSASLINLAEIEAENIADYRRDISHPCARFVFNVLAAWDSARYSIIASQLNTMHTRALQRMPKPRDRDRELRRYVGLFQLNIVNHCSVCVGDIALMSVENNDYMSHCGIWTDQGVIHLHPKLRDLHIDHSPKIIMLVRN